MQSKTVLGLLVILGLAVGLQWSGNLSPEMVEVIKYVGGAYFVARSAANIGESRRA